MRLFLLLLLATTQVTSGVHLLRGNFTPGSQPDGNTIVFDAPRGLVVVDTGRHAAHTKAILDFAAARGKKIHSVINTHWHLDHIGGNAMLRKEVPGLRVYATPALDDALKGFLANYANQLRKRIAESNEESHRTELALIESGRQLAPDEVIRASTKRRIAGRTLHLNVETDAVTAGDLWIFDPATKTLVAGDLVTLPFPFLDTACPPRWHDALQRIEATDFKTLIPGHGPPMTRGAFARYSSSYSALLACAESDRTNAQCADEWLRGVGDLVPPGERDFARQGLDYYLTQHLRAKKDTCP